MSSELTAQQALEAAGFSIADLQAQLNDQGDQQGAGIDYDALATSIVEAMRTTHDAATSPTSEQRAQQLGQDLLDSITKAQTPWYSIGGTAEGTDDAA